MRAGLSTIQQTLTPEAASVLNHSIAEAGRRNHGQTTPLHVAATLLLSSNGYLRQACIKSHPNSSHPLQCRALELCFSVALERLPTAQNMSPGTEPPISNALMAALKRAQAHQRRGCPEQQQQPLLAVKVELEQLIISILDDPSVSRVMREASFSSPAVKATIEQSLNSTPPANSTPIGLGFRPTSVVSGNSTRNLYLNPRLQQGSIAQPAQQRGEEVKKVIDILLRTKKKNPVLVGESEPEAVVKELLKRIESKELGEGPLNNVQVIRLEQEFQIPAKIKELEDLVESRMTNSNSGGVILDMGDLKWLVQQPANMGISASSGTAQQPVVSEGGRSAVAEMGKLLTRYGDGGGVGRRLWLIGTATCETYLRCQVYHPSMEHDWDLQAVPIASRSPLPGLFPRLGTTGIPNSPVESLSSIKGFSTAATIPMRQVMPESLDFGRRTSCCPQCMQNYEQELEILVVNEFDKPSSVTKLEGGKSSLPQWLQNAKVRDEEAKKNDKTENLDKELIKKQKTQELLKKWNETCLRLHPNFHNINKFSSDRPAPMSLPITGLCGPNLLGRQPFQPKLQLNKGLSETLQLKTNPPPCNPSEQVVSISQSEGPIRTELVLGRTKECETLADQTHKERVRDFLGCISSESENKSCELQSNKLLSTSDIDSYKRLFKGLLEKVWWQQEAASALATTVTQFKLGKGKRRGTVAKGDMWLMFMGPDRVGKRKMANALADLVSGSSTVNICLGSNAKRSDGEPDVGIRGRTVLDRISEAVRRNRFSVIILEDIDESDLLVRGSIKRAMERGRFTDSHGREISLGNIIFILTTKWIPDDLKHLSNGNSLEEEKFTSLARSTCQLKLSLVEKTAKRRADWGHAEGRSSKPRVETGSAMAFDLNEAADVEDERTDGSLNSSDVTIDHETEHGLNNRQLSFTTSSAPREMFGTVDNAVMFKAVDFTPIKHSITNSINRKFSSIVGGKISLELQDNAVEKITSGVWLGNTNVEEWSEKVLVPSLKELKGSLPSFIEEESVIVKLESDNETGHRSSDDQLPCTIKVVVGGKTAERLHS